jgi:hypothetical protein
MKIDPKFFESGAVTAISGEFGPMGELAVIKLLCAIRDSGYYLEWSVQRKMMMLRMLPGVTFDTLERIVERLAEYGFFSSRKLKSGVLTSAEIQKEYIREIGAGKARRRLGWPHLLVDLQEFGIIPAADDATVGEEPYDTPLRIDRMKPLAEQPYMKVRLRTTNPAIHIYRRVDNPDFMHRTVSHPPGAGIINASRR